MKKFLILLLFFVGLSISANAQQKEAGPHDFGKMWTFENSPKSWFTEAYNFTPGDSWFEDVRLASLRMSTGCSASFVSPNGLIMTNHHCSRDVALGAQKEGEDIMKNGFFADDFEEERNVPSVFFEQLRMLEDITDMVNKFMAESQKEGMESKQIEALGKIKKHYGTMESWKDLRLQVVQYYSGVKFSLYGYKKFSDIRLVAIPELDVASFGGDPDNFTYPRYDVDFTFWRAYDEEGNPVNSSENYLKFNIDGAVEGETVFVVGNPARTERYRTVEQLKWDKNYRYPITLDFLGGVIDNLQHDYDKEPNEQKMNMIFGMLNSQKAYTGIYNGLKDPDLFGRKVEIEERVRKDYTGKDHWSELKLQYDNLAPHSWAMMILSPSPMRGNTVMLMHSINKYIEQKNNGASEDDLEDIADQISYMAGNIGDAKDKYYLTMTMELINKYIPDNNNSMAKLLNGNTPKEYVELMIEKSKFFKGDGWKKFLKMDANKLNKKKDMLLVASKTLIPQYNNAVKAFGANNELRKELEGKVAQEYFNYFGSDLPPDATGTLRISDGAVKGYDYNGTKAPFKTTFFGMYDRNYSNDNTFPWRLPYRWQNPPKEMLKYPMNFVSTNDIIGGNSGSPILNKNKEVVGLIFDGNIESLPGNFIFDEEHNRSVSVHSGGIYACLKYIYHAKRLMDELVPEK